MSRNRRVSQEAWKKGTILVQVLRGLIALHRIERSGQSHSTQADTVRRALGKVIDGMDNIDKARAKQFSNELQTADLSSSDAVIIETIIRKVTR